MATCYHITEQTGRTMVPCNHTAVAEGKHSNCCTEEYLCLSNGMCRAPKLTSVSNYYWRIGCTDKTFSDPACGKYCAQVPFVQADDNWKQLIWQCPGSESYCCNTGKQTLYEDRVGRTNTSCCDKKDLVFKAPDPVVVGTASSIAQPFPTMGTSIALSSPISSGSTVNLPSGAAPTPSSSADAIQPSSLSTHKSVALPVGLGVSLGLVAVIAVCVGLLIVRRRKQRYTHYGEERKQAPVELMASGPSEMMTVERPVELVTPTVKN
ncbi:hypothetical protein CC86DRAFT_425407 [Ophiobolus disseminans]|uniref:Mid2 domain-containing protein n=1 Tax=Ophiobolus disseminans TaxID=1469910 RepID=A0A6A7AJ53_9PLEO|nr:hypothetical protein CC86DRAFT_425407 [Ophiobolus disseminans]